MRELMRCWYSIALKTLVIPGNTLISLFAKTSAILVNVASCKSLDIHFGAFLTELVRKVFKTAKENVASRFSETLIDPIQHLDPYGLKRFNKSVFIKTAQAAAIRDFRAKANAMHPFVSSKSKQS
jgi:hypothetical protein